MFASKSTFIKASNLRVEPQLNHNGYCGTLLSTLKAAPRLPVDKGFLNNETFVTIHCLFGVQKRQ